MPEEKMTLGQAIDRIIEALEPLDGVTRETALLAVCSHLDIALDKTSISSQITSPIPPLPKTQPTATTQETAQQIKHTKIDIRTLKEQKQPSSAKQMACIVAYYLQEMAPPNERKDTVSTQDLEKYFKQASFRLPNKLEQVLIDAKRSGYFESATRGEYTLNAVGYNLVAHSLPKQKGT